MAVRCSRQSSCTKWLKLHCCASCMMRGCWRPLLTSLMTVICTQQATADAQTSGKFGGMHSLPCMQCIKLLQVHDHAGSSGAAVAHGAMHMAVAAGVHG